MRRRPAAALAVALTLGSLAFGAARPASAVNEPGGRITIDESLQLLGRIDAYEEHRIGSGLATVSANADRGVPGVMVVHSCGLAPSVDDPHVPIGSSASELTVTRADDACVTTSVAAWVILWRHGDIDPVPRDDGLQYVALDRPVPVFSDPVDSREGAETPIELPTPPPHATHAVLRIVSSHDTAGWVSLDRCGTSANGRQSQTRSPMPVTVWHVPVDSGACIRGVLWDAGRAPAFGPYVNVEVEGYLATSGPDQYSVPPTYWIADDISLDPRFSARHPRRILDTRNGGGCAVDGGFCWPPAGRLGSPGTLTLGVGATATPTTSAVSLNVTVVEPDFPGFLTVWPCDRPRPDTSNLNWEAGETRANHVVAKVARRTSDLVPVTEVVVCIGVSIDWSRHRGLAVGSLHLLVDSTGVYDELFGAPATAVDPERLLDTRNAIGVSTRTRVPAAGVVELQVAGRGGVPADAAAVTLNATAVEPLANGFVTVWPCDARMPDVSTLNYTTGRNVPNLVTVGLSPAGTVCLYTYGSSHLLADVAAWYGDGGSTGLADLVPQRILDTRNAIGAPKRPVRAGEVVTLQVAGRGGVPHGAEGVVMNTTITNVLDDGFLTVWPCDRPRPDVSNLNFRRGDSVPNVVTVRLSSEGTVCLSANATTDILADVAGYLTSEQTVRPTLVVGYTDGLYW